MYVPVPASPVTKTVFVRYEPSATTAEIAVGEQEPVVYNTVGATEVFSVVRVTSAHKDDGQQGKQRRRQLRSESCTA